MGRLWQGNFEFKFGGSRSTHKLLLRESSGGYSRVNVYPCAGGRVGVHTRWDLRPPLAAKFAFARKCNKHR